MRTEWPLFKMPPVSAGRWKSIAGKNSAWCYLVAAIAELEALIVYRTKIAFGIKELAGRREVYCLHPIVRYLTLITAESAAIADIFPGLLVEKIHLYGSK